MERSCGEESWRGFPPQAGRGSRGALLTCRWASRAPVCVRFHEAQGHWCVWIAGCTESPTWASGCGHPACLDRTQGLLGASCPLCPHQDRDVSCPGAQWPGGGAVQSCGLGQVPRVASLAYGASPVRALEPALEQTLPWRPCPWGRAVSPAGVPAMCAVGAGADPTPRGHASRLL